MGYKPKNKDYYKRKNTRKSSKFIKNNKGAKSQAKQILTLSRQVSNLKRRTSTHAQWTLPLEGETGNGTDLVDGAFYVSSMVRPFAYDGLFQTTILGGEPIGAAYITAQQCRLNSATFSVVFSPSVSVTPLTPRMINFYILKLKEETASDVLQKTGGMSTAGLNTAAAANSNIVLREDVGGGLSTMIRWNPAAFDIKYQKTLTLANIVQETAVPETNVAITNTRDALRRFHFNIKMNTLLKPASGTWKEMNEPDVFPSDRYYMVVHVGGFAGDDSPINGVRMDCLQVYNTTLYE